MGSFLKNIVIILAQHDDGIISGIFFLGHVINLKKNERNKNSPLFRWIECICWQLAFFFLKYIYIYPTVYLERLESMTFVDPCLFSRYAKCQLHHLQ